ncbi:2-amino-4-hydroxy-6-hydroxymethyldihydropteridine diphosphokinase [Niallia endozanthoxylica]|uniref:2-amino-4-hydroxy-6-hydroxymethyldihydropteridine diphosphokinase n=1 Tax=Niallia endozanthoxylica TaxID=2036016 RepID=A0A5J5GX10_9BACI|nr:2-amino-4-hydroxy-6-hydroxymethyldihydropteridine diphosphokinase [Niallia endozanthoxylica]KAA9011984.1 2-amino-4-hydroxy-6-hydroxymethyldihydropteridine diphosphokinase [Niallia endozanthoxylica]
MTHTAYLSLGSNMGNRMNNLKEALKRLQGDYPVTVVNVSSVYETDPVGYEEQDLFLNMVAQINTTLSPYQLLEACLQVEKGLGRKREIHWGPRTVDLDILLYNDENIITEMLVVPHPRMHERSFVMIPLVEISPDILLPKFKQPLYEIADQLSDKEGVRVWKEKNGEDVFELFEN